MKGACVTGYDRPSVLKSQTLKYVAILQDEVRWREVLGERVHCPLVPRGLLGGWHAPGADHLQTGSETNP